MNQIKGFNCFKLSKGIWVKYFLKEDVKEYELLNFQETGGQVEEVNGYQCSCGRICLDEENCVKCDKLRDDYEEFYELEDESEYEEEREEEE